MRFATLAALTLVACGANAWAALPPPSEGEKAQAAQAKAKADWEAKVQGYLLCKAQDHAVAEYRADMQRAGKPTKPATALGKPCTDPGPYAAQTSAPPIEAAGAHSPADTAKGPPSTTQPAAEQGSKP